MDKRLRGSAAKAGREGFRLPGGRRTWLIGGGAALVLVAGGLTWALWPDGRPDPRARVYTESTACLLTPAGGTADKRAAPVWAGMQQASLDTHGKVQFLEVDGPQTGANAVTYLGTLVGGKCDVILTVGAAPNAALDAAAPSQPNVHFVRVGAGKAHANVSVIDDADPAAVTERVRSVVADVLSDAKD
ncbi:hypothetical protein EV385_2468 [Krasilnikovia cinnamomea]|uniref:BMP family ABC transporter substrate-binding protein n=1 Tax=Krasilnikovia cinnamomea TaxID=349313 RepID=A0A4Q7ZKI1_9ACTN|nr:BMP family ABC transporter substrate-binding protein [Krasilnikovia cinnamomea]RZU50689.1 hypothetical protein EV385_2468 [Krasilnikovia cinnamomea]